ncbi:MAG TPA: hypothetical protein DIT04_08515 [Dysgonomonas sp.]|nr:hypothetical protein [Dysgonomonas sp.]
MKKKLWILVFIAAQMFIIYDASCTAQTRTKPSDKKTEAVAYFWINKGASYTPDEIRQNDSVKALPQDYTMVKEREAIEKGSFRYLNFGQDRIRLTGVTQEQAYLRVYREYCDEVFISLLSAWTNSENMSYGFFKITMKLFNNDGLNILRLVDFPDKKEKEAAIISSQIRKNIPSYLRFSYDIFKNGGLSLSSIEIFLEKDSIFKHQYDSLSLRLPWQIPAAKKSSGKNSYLKSLPVPRIK